MLNVIKAQFVRANRKKKPDWLATNTDVITDQSHSLSRAENNSWWKTGLIKQYIYSHFNRQPITLRRLLLCFCFNKKTFQEVNCIKLF